MRDFSSTRHWALPAAAVGAAVLAAAAVYFHQSAPRLLLAPMIGLDTCISPGSTAETGDPRDGDLAASCSGPQGSAAKLVESTLSGLQPAGSGPTRYDLGYTLNVPLLRLFKERDGDWILDTEMLGRVVRTVRDTNRPAVLYLFSTHFGQNAAIEAELGADTANLAWTIDGPLAKDTYYGSDIYNWSVHKRTAIAARRVQAAQAVLKEICKLEPEDVQKIKAITLLGEVHQLFPDFQSGMGFAPPYRITDYSDLSKAAFRKFLEEYFGKIARLNTAVGTEWISFDQVEPPSKDIRTAPLRDYTEHIDSYAHGWLPISGWAYVPGASYLSPAMVRIYRNGELLARMPASQGRQDVLAALPQIGTANIGWRFDLDFRQLPTGLYRIDVLLENTPDDLVRLASRTVSILDRNQQAPKTLPQKMLPSAREPDATIKANVDLPADQSSYFYNPLVTYWHAFRALQVADYLQWFDHSLSAPCIARTPRYTHQIIPFTNPSWDETKFATDASLRELKGIELGVSLYGEPTYGRSFLNFLGKGGQRHYSVTEFHPLKPLDAGELDRVFATHEAHGARFLSFFLEPRWNGRVVTRSHNLFSLDPDNARYGSAELYRSLQQLMGNERAVAAKAAPARNRP